MEDSGDSAHESRGSPIGDASLEVRACAVEICKRSERRRRACRALLPGWSPLALRADARTARLASRIHSSALAPEGRPQERKRQRLGAAGLWNGAQAVSTPVFPSEDELLALISAGLLLLRWRSRLDPCLDAQVSDRLFVQHQLLPGMQLHGLSSIFSRWFQHCIACCVGAPALIAVLTFRTRSVSLLQNPSSAARSPFHH